MQITIYYADEQTDDISATDLAPYRDVVETVALRGADSVLEFFAGRRWPVEDAYVSLGEVDLYFFDPVADRAAASRWMSR